jgi:hypothetical protein
MISAIEWVPAGVADPSPKKYEFSAAELELIQMMEKQNFGEGGTIVEEELEVPPPPKEKKEKKITLTKIENSLPADLRMDEYSSDEDENDAVQGTAIGRLLVDDTNEAEPVEEEQEEEEVSEEDEKNEEGDIDMDSDDSDDSDDDDLADVPDTREYTPIDLEGLKAMGFSQAGTNAPAYMNLPENGEEDEDDDSEAEDVQIQPDDAIVVVAKTEEVSNATTLQ